MCSFYINKNLHYIYQNRSILSKIRTTKQTKNRRIETALTYSLLIIHFRRKESQGKRCYRDNFAITFHYCNEKHVLIKLN